MGFNPRLNPVQKKTTFASVASSASTLQPIFSPIQAGQMLNARFINGGAASIGSGTTAGSALNVYVYKTASDTSASNVASARLGSVATLATVALTMGTSTALTRFSNGDVYCAELNNGALNDPVSAGCVVQISYMYAQARDDTATP